MRDTHVLYSTVQKAGIIMKGWPCTASCLAELEGGVWSGRCDFTNECRRLEGWPNTAARLAGSRRVTQQGAILYVMDGPCRLSCRTVPSTNRHDQNQEWQAGSTLYDNSSVVMIYAPTPTGGGVGEGGGGN